MNDFNSVGKFHEKFGLPRSGPHVNNPPHELPEEAVSFRIKFLLEELEELCHGYGVELKWTVEPYSTKQNLVKVADALVDLVYVALGTAHLHNLPWAALFHEVHKANMKKVRCSVDHTFQPDLLNERYCVECGMNVAMHSMRGSKFDVIKPPGWLPPDIEGVLDENWWVAKE